MKKIEDSGKSKQVEFHVHFYMKFIQLIGEKGYHLCEWFNLLQD